ncbi:fungal specific transcription factor domain-containing [Trichoderma arundinaceum]|uniref:Fungal specific transcription factor domain-containing n=1 Tax=Trichoderma arundinaceum TaxID=490622 RepID=A0A395P4W7_TRIAR|nr:fungal specific transcription factor domain-containing [Trichoderma arundinaceum]
MGSHANSRDTRVVPCENTETLNFSQDIVNGTSSKDGKSSTRVNRAANKPLQFVTVTSANQKDDKDISKVVRTQVMKDYFWKQRNPESTEQAARDLPANPQQYKGRFRLNSQPSKAKAKTSAKKEKSRGKKSDDLVRAQRGRIMMPRGPITDLRVYDPDGFFASTPACLLGGSLDNFDSFRLELKPESMKLIYYYKQSYHRDVLDLNVGGGYCLFDAREHRSLFHAILYLVALDFNLRRGFTDDLGCLYHSSEAFRLINEQIREGIIEDATIAAVALIALKENLAGMFDISYMHMQGLKYMVQKRGGIQNIKGVHRGVVMWADFCNSSVWNCPPQFPHSSSSTKQGIDVPSQTTSEDGLSNTELQIASLIQSLRDISAAKDLNGSVAQSKKETSNRVYDIEYKLHVLQSSYSRSRSVSNEVVPLCVALNIYLYLAIRELPARAQMIHRLVDRLRITISMQPMQWWTSQQQKNQSWILWTLFVGYGAAVETGKEEWFVQALKSAYAKSGIQNMDGLREALKSVLWQESWSEHYFKKLRAHLED